MVFKVTDGFKSICWCWFIFGGIQNVLGREAKNVNVEFPVDTVQIKIDSGILQGNIRRTKEGQNYYNFQGIPYAVPPLNDLRFKDPIPYKKWSGVLNATLVPQSCVQITLRQITYAVEGQEDCLYLNVFTSQNPHTVKRPLPVMVWIYGGAFREGYKDIYGPDYLMREDVVVVTLNYRVGVFGFLSTQDASAPGNYGMKDIVLALKWIKRNIGRFGGNSDKITIFGESAGAAIVGYLMLSRQSRNLFNAAIMQSGTPLCTWALHRNPRKVAFDLGVSLGIVTNSSAALIRYLKSLDLSKTHQAMINVNLLNFPDSFNNGGPFGPVLEPENEHAFLTKDSYRALKRGDFHKVPVLMGVNSQESILFNSLLGLTRSLFFLYDLSPSSLVRTAMSVKSVKDRRIVGLKIKQFYFKSGSFVGATDEEISEFFSDDLFVRPVTKTAQLLSRHVPVYFYVYDFEGAMGRAWVKYASQINRNVNGVAHATELWYLWKARWNNLDFKTNEERLTSDRLVKLWTNFATYGNPTPTVETIFQNVRWPKVKGPNVDYFYIGADIKTARNFKERSLNFWNNLYANYSKGPFETY